MPAAEHLVVGGLELPDGSAGRALRRAGVDPDRFRRALGIPSTADDATEGSSSGPLRTTKSAQKVFKRVTKLVRKERSQLYGAYVLLVAAEEDETTRQALRDLGVSPEDVATAARLELDELNG